MSLYQSITVDAELQKGIIEADADLEKSIIEVDAEIVSIIRTGSDWGYYDGPYVVIPTAEGFELDTELKIMRDDVTVEPIPYTEVSNLSGGLTVNIA